jgi:hypothetical protein
LKIYNPIIVSDKVVTLAKYKILPPATDIIAGFVRPCRAYKRLRILCAVAIEK